ncbi:MAG: hypothetical protein RLZZ488_281 [Pseudomonadota bacterium]|jgi:parvulin-like peptidyl-prolyl isomerase
MNFKMSSMLNALCRSAHRLLLVVSAVSPLSAQSNEVAKTPNSTASAANKEPTLTANTLDAVIVTIADEPMLLSELQRAVFIASEKRTRLSPQGQLLGGQLSTADAEIILEQLINQKILGIRARELGLNLGDDELDSELRAFLQQQNISEDKFQEILQAEGETVESHREEFRKQVETQRFIGRVIRPLVSVTDDQIRGYYMQMNANKEKSQLVRLRQLKIDFPSGLSEEQRQAKIRVISEIQKDLNSGRPFSDLVRLHSNAKDAQQTGGEIPPIPLKELRDELRVKVMELIRAQGSGEKPSAFIGPIDLKSSVLFFEFLGTQLGDQKEYEKLKPQLEAKLLDIKLRERLDEYLRNERLKVKVGRREIRFSR